MLLPTPFDERTQALCQTWNWKEWAGHRSVCTYGLSLEREYNAIRQGSAVIDVSPLFKYDISGKNAGDFLARVLSRDVRKMKSGRMTYLCWTDDNGKILDDGTCARLSDSVWRLTAAGPAYSWLMRHAAPFDVKIEDLTDQMAALAIQGPTSKQVLSRICNADMDELAFFGVKETIFGHHIKGWVSRTGYTGDLGYEVWTSRENALALWDLIFKEGEAHGAVPVGLDALDISRVEAGFILRGVDYTAANEALCPSQKATPFEVGLGWTVRLKDREPFIGQQALLHEKQKGSKWALVGLDIDWTAIENLYAEHGLPPDMAGGAWRCGIPIYAGGKQIGRATSGTWSPILKKNIALATVQAGYQRIGSQLNIEWTVEWSRETVPCTVTKTPFFDPERKRA